jgi:hypothetical protein
MITLLLTLLAQVTAQVPATGETFTGQEADGVIRMEDKRGRQCSVKVGRQDAYGFSVGTSRCQDGRVGRVILRGGRHGYGDLGGQELELLIR